MPIGRYVSKCVDSTNGILISVYFKQKQTANLVHREGTVYGDQELRDTLPGQNIIARTITSDTRDGHISPKLETVVSRRGSESAGLPRNQRVDRSPMAVCHNKTEHEDGGKQEDGSTRFHQSVRTKGECYTPYGTPQVVET